VEIAGLSVRFMPEAKGKSRTIRKSQHIWGISVGRENPDTKPCAKTKCLLHFEIEGGIAASVRVPRYQVRLWDRGALFSVVIQH
jgi:hypothetical protein